jgi:hypothetical protein
VKKHQAFLFYFSIFGLGFSASLQAGTEVKAFLQSSTGQSDWVNVHASIQQGQMRLDWKGPWSKGSLLYDRETSQVSLVDPLHRSVFLLPSADQTTLKLVLALFAGQLKKKADGADAETRRNLALFAKNAQSFFNGVPQLEKKDGSVGSFSCDTYVTNDAKGGKMREVWVTSSEATGMDAEDYNTFRSLAHLSLDLSDPLLSQWGADTGTFEQNFSVSDFPIQEVLYVKGRTSAKFKVLSVRSRGFGPETFQLPNGCKTLGLLDLLRQSSGN